MANKYLNTRILLKYDTIQKWNANNPVLLKGEVAVVSVETDQKVEQVNGTVPPQILFKVGDGKSNFKALKWASGIAADVYDWAKAATKPEYNASEIKGLSDYISGEIQDTNTTYQIIAGSTAGMYQLQKKEINGGWTNEGNEFGVDEDAIKELITAAQNKANSAYTLAEGKAAKIDAIGTVKAGDTADKIVIKAVSGASKDNTITINNVADATNATNVNLVATGTGTASIKVQAGTGTAAEFTVNNVAKATNADEATNVSTNINGHAINSIFEADGITAKAATKAAQDGNGKNIAATYATITTVNGKLGKTETAADSNKLGTKTKDEVIAEAREGYATTTYVDNKVAGSVQYLGLASKLTDLDVNAGKGDFYRASADFSGVSSGDLIVSLKDEVKTQTIDTTNFAVVKSSDDYQGTVKSVAGKGSNGITVTGGPITETGTLTVAHDAGTAASKAKGFYKISTDAGSHVASVEAVGASDITTALGYTPYNATNPNGYTTNKGTVTSVSGTDGLKGSVTTSGSLSVDFDVVAKKTDLPTVNDGKFTVKGDNKSIAVGGTGYGTANQAGNTEAILSVNDYANIITAKNAGESIETAGDLINENEDVIFFCCGDSSNCGII